MKPKSDDHFTYDASAHRYKLTEQGVLQRLNRNLGDVLAVNGGAFDPRNEPNILLDRVSRQIYGYIYNTTITPKRKERELALNPAYRVPLMEAMEEQLIYVLNNGDLSAYTGINIETGTAIDPARMRAAEIAPLARDVLLTHGLCSPSFSLHDREITPRYSEEGY